MLFRSQGSIGGDGHGSKNERKGSGDILGFKIGYRLSEGGVRGKRCENAIILESG